VEVFVLEIKRFSVPRTSGRDLTQVRRPTRRVRPNVATMRKADLIALAESRGIDSEGTVADLRERLADG
jgi:hypothetical protein